MGIRDRDFKAFGFLLATAGYLALKFASTGRIFDIPSAAGAINVDMVLGIAFMGVGLGALVLTLQTRKTENGLPLLGGLLFILGFLNVHLSQTAYLYPVQIVPLSIVGAAPIGGEGFAEIGQMMALAINFIGLAIATAIFWLLKR